MVLAPENQLAFVATTHLDAFFFACGLSTGIALFCFGPFAFERKDPSRKHGCQKEVYYFFICFCVFPVLCAPLCVCVGWRWDDTMM